MLYLLTSFAFPLLGESLVFAFNLAVCRLSEGVLLGANSHRSGHVQTLLGSLCLVAEENNPFAFIVTADTDSPA